MRRLRGAEISMIFQEPFSAPNPLMCVGSQVTEVITAHRRVPSRAAARARTLELLAAVKIPDPAEAARAYPHQLSGGQRQRAMIAMVPTTPRCCRRTSRPRPWMSQCSPRCSS